MCSPKLDWPFSCRFQIEKSQGEIYRLRAKLESTQSENDNLHDELEKMQQALNRSYADRDKIATDIEKIRDDLERSQVNWKDRAIQHRWPFVLRVYVNFQSSAGKYQLQNEKTQQALEKTQNEFDRLQEKFERAQNDTRRVSLWIIFKPFWPPWPLISLYLSWPNKQPIDVWILTHSALRISKFDIAA